MFYKCLQITLEEHIMSNRRMAAAGVLNARAALNNQAAAAALMHPNALMYGQQRRPQNAGPPPILPGLPAAAMIEQKLHAQHNEIQRLLAENQRLAATHVALRQELAASQQEVQRAQSIIQGVQNDKEVQVRYHVEKPNMCFHFLQTSMYLYKLRVDEGECRLIAVHVLSLWRAFIGFTTWLIESTRFLV